MRIDPKIDYAFKCLFGSEENKDILISLLNAILSADIREVELLNPFNPKDAPDEKYSILDVKARIGDGTRINIEMQIQLGPDYPARGLYYWSKLYSDQLKQGEDYTQLARTVAIHILDSVLFPKLSDPHLEFRICSPTHPEVEFTDRFALHTIELPKVGLKDEDAVTVFDQWCCFLKHAPEWDPEHPPITMREAAIRRAIERLKVMFQTEHERELYEGRIKAIRDENWRQKASLKEGLQQGLQQGIQQGIQESIRRGLDRRFGTESRRVQDRVNAVQARERLDALLDAAWTVASLEEFEKLLG